MSLNEEIPALANNEIDGVINKINAVNKKGKDLAYLSIVFPWVLIALWRLLWYIELIPAANTLPGIQSNISELALFEYWLLFMSIWFIGISITVYLIGLFIVWKPIREVITTLPFYGCVTTRGCEQLIAKLNDMKFDKQMNNPI
jgi:hypothetical protein